MKKILFVLLLVPFIGHAQYNDGFDLWRENDCYKHIMKLITDNAGKITDTCDPVYKSESKDIYIIDREYMKPVHDVLHDSINGYILHFFNDEADLSEVRNKIKEAKAPVLFLTKWTNHLENYSFWVFTVKVKKNKIEYDSKGMKFKYYFHPENGKFEYKGAECLDW